MYLERFQEILKELQKAVEEVYGQRLVTLAVFGSVGRNTPRPDSDIDLLIVADDLPPGPDQAGKRVRTGRGKTAAAAGKNAAKRNRNIPLPPDQGAWRCPERKPDFSGHAGRRPYSLRQKLLLPKLSNRTEEKARRTGSQKGIQGWCLVLGAERKIQAR